MTIASPFDATHRGDAVRDADIDHILTSAADAFERLAGSDLLITGGGGFLGYYLTQAALAYGDRDPSRPIQVTVFDSFIRGLPDWLDELRDHPRLTVRAQDLRDPLPDDMPDFDFIIHAAGIASPTFYRAHPIETMDANITGLRTLLDHAVAQAGRARPVRGFLFYSSSEIYGDPSADAIPTPETYRGFVSCTGPRACYDESKRYGETLCVTFAQVHGLPITMARPFNNYGPGMKITDGRVIADFARNILDGADITMLSDGSPTRTFCYVADAVAGYYKVLALGRPGEPYNVGVEGPEISMIDLARAMGVAGHDLFGYAGTITAGVSPEAVYLVDNPSRRRPSIDKARAELAFEPSIGLEDGLRRTLLWYRDNQGGERR
jgi:dTDP-glucose 4,6-dehydratase/UDP-glucuronate decarboxylase